MRPQYIPALDKTPSCWLLPSCWLRTGEWPCAAGRGIRARLCGQARIQRALQIQGLRGSCPLCAVISRFRTSNPGTPALKAAGGDVVRAALLPALGENPCVPQARQLERGPVPLDSKEGSVLCVGQLFWGRGLCAFAVYLRTERARPFGQGLAEDAGVVGGARQSAPLAPPASWTCRLGSCRPSLTR